MVFQVLYHVGKAQKLPLSRLLSVGCFQRSTYYDVLDVSKNASLEEVKKAFYDKSKQYHPDRHQGDDEMHSKFIQITEAYGVLSNPEKRALYNMDLSRVDPRKSPHVVIRSKDYQSPYRNVKGYSTDWSDFYSTYGGGKAERDMKRDADSQFWKEYWEHTKKYGGGEMQDGLSPAPKSTVGIEMVVVFAVLIGIYILGFFHSSSDKRSLDHDSFDSEHLKWLMAQKKER